MAIARNRRNEFHGDRFVTPSSDPVIRLGTCDTVAVAPGNAMNIENDENRAKSIGLNRRSLVKRLVLGTAGLSVVSSFPIRLSAGEAQVHQHLPRSSPEAQGVASSGVLKFLDAWAASGDSLHSEPHSFMMVRRGHVVAEGWWWPYRPDGVHHLYSLSKSFTSTAVGFAVAEGELKVEDKVTSFFPGDLPSDVSVNLAALRVRDLLTMSVGHAEDSTRIITKEHDWVRAFLAIPIEHPPGSEFLYDSGASYMLSAIVQKISGQKVIDYLQPRLFGPLNVQGMMWETCPYGINTGGWGLSVTTETLGKFGQLYLQRGLWNGRQLLPAQWVEEATTFKIQQPVEPNGGMGPDYQQGYAYQFWRCRHNAFRGDGAFGQFCIVMPDQEAVIAITCDTPLHDMQGVLSLMWEHLLPAMHDKALPTDRTSAAELEHKLASMTLPPPVELATSAAMAQIAHGTFKLEPNSLGAQSVSFNFRDKSCVFALKDDVGLHEIHCGIGNWVDGMTNLRGTPPRLSEVLEPEVGVRRPIKVAAAGAWKGENTFEMQWRYYETPHHDTVTCRFSGDQVTIEFLNSIAQMETAAERLRFGGETRPILRGQIST